MVSLPLFLNRIILVALPLLLLFATGSAEDATDTKPSVVVKTFKHGKGPAVRKGYVYNALMTLYVENPDGTKRKGGVTTRKADGAADDIYYEMEPAGNEMIEGLKIGILQMREGDRAMIHIPSHLAYGDKAVGTEGGPVYVPAGANVIFDIEIRGRKGYPEQEL